MEPPPLPSSSGRFRLRVQIYPPQEAYNLNAAPLRQFTIVKTHVLALPDLTLQELCDEVVKRFKVIYPGESLFAIDKPQDSYGSDLYLGDRVRDVFEDNEIFRVIKGATIRSSVEPHRARSQSVQPNGVLQHGSAGSVKRIYGQVETEDSTRAQKRQRIVTDEPDRPVRSKERDTVEREAHFPEEQVREVTVIQDSQQSTTEGRVGQCVNGLSPRITKSGQKNSSQARHDSSIDRQHSNTMTRSSGFHQRISSQLSIASSKDEADTSDSDAHLPRSRAISRSKRKLNFIDDSSEQDRGQSISTAVTTPQSVLQQPKNQSPIVDNKKLRRPTARAGKNITADGQVNKTFPRQNIYEVIETDTERTSVKPVPQDVLSKISNSNKWKTYRSSTTPNSDKSSPQQHQRIGTKDSNLQVPEEKTSIREDQQQTVELEQNRAAKLAKQRAEQELSRIAFEAAERRRLDAEQKKKEREAKIEFERVAAEEVRKEVEAEEAQRIEEAEATSRREALVRAEAANAAQLVEKARLEEEATARLDEERNARLEEDERAREASEADKLRLEIEVLRKAEDENDLKEQAVLRSRQENKQKSQRLRASLEATVRRAASMPAKAVPAREGHAPGDATPHANGIGSAPNANSVAASKKRVTCTPFIPRGRPSELGGVSLHPSLSRVPSPSVGLEDQMPMPPQLKRKVSFVDQVLPSARRSSSTSSSLKQTTLVPRRLGITDVKSTPKRTPLKANANYSKLSKGKAKVVESPGKSATPTIAISSDEESTTNMSEQAMQHNSFKGVGSPGPAYRTSAASQVLSPPKSQSFTNVIELDEPAEHRRSLNKRGAERTDRGESNSPRKSFTGPLSSAPQHKKNLATPEPSSSRFFLSDLLTPTRLNQKALQSDDTASTQSRNSPKSAEAPHTGKGKQSEPGFQEAKPSMPTDNDSEDELDSIDAPNALKSTDVPSSVSVDREEATDLEADRSKRTNDEDEDDSGSAETHGASRHSSIQESIKNQQDNSIKRQTDKDETQSNEEVEEESDNMEADTQDESSEEELEEYSDAMQAQVDDQLLAQSFESSFSSQQASSIPKNSKALLAAPKDVGLLQNHGSGRPSLRRMNLEAQRTKEANLQAAKARGLEKAQKLHGAARPSELLEESLEEASSSESSSTSSEYDNDDDEPVASARSKKPRASNAEENHGDLDKGEVQELSEQELAKSGSCHGSSSTRASALKSPSKGPDLMFRPRSRLQKIGDKKDGKNSAKIGWAKLGKQFSASKHRNGI